MMMMLAEEVVVPDQEQVQEELLALVDSDDDERRPLRQKRKRLSQKKKKKKKTRQKSKRVHFADTSSSSSSSATGVKSALSWVIPIPQVQICWQDDDNESQKQQHQQRDQNTLNHLNTSAGPKRIVRYHCGAERSSSPAADDNSWCLLAAFVLPQDVEVVVMLEGEQQPLEHLTNLPVTSQWGAMDLLRLVLRRAPPHKTATTRAIPAIGRAVAHDNTLGMHLCQGQTTSEWYLRVYLLPPAFEICNPWQLPVHLKSQSWRSKRLAPVVDLQMALATLFPDSILEDAATRTCSPPPPAAATTITAKQVYALTDNVQLQAVMENHQKKATPLQIPGLIPTLRLYQKSAVRWMLERESVATTQCHEWKLAWVVLDTSERSSKITSLMDWKSENQSARPIAVLYCPFTGWLAKSVEAARTMTTPISNRADGGTSGGILAESMGLGKTVEVLACILANPRPEIKDATPSVKRKLDFDESEAVSVTASAMNHVVPSSTAGVGVINDFSEFGDVDDDSSDEQEETGVTAIHPATPGAATESTAVPVTPDKPATILQPAEERWLDDAVVGSCICSKLITFSTRKKDWPVILCSSCNEPMHKPCAAFESEAEMMSCTKPIHFRQRFTNHLLECRLCDEEICPCCTASHQRPIRSSATLIITPAAILGQWNREIKRHATTPDGNPLHVVVYEGMNRLCKSNLTGTESFKYVHPRHLAKADIVLMTFDALMADLGHSDDNKFVARAGESDVGEKLRARKRYRVVPSPLQSIQWWRICLDEAQRVETPTAGSARMALKLHAEHRWCVSGTPVGRGKMEDLYGLLLFLRLEPFADKNWFVKCFNPAYRYVHDRIRHLLRNVFWRSTKAMQSVREQMGVPEQIEKRVLLRLSSIEKHFYDRQLEQTLSTAGEMPEREKSGKKRKAAQLNLLAECLHRLRAACCHPQVGSSGIGLKRRKIGSKPRDPGTVDASLGSRVMSMNQILDRFIDDAKQKCEEAQRLVILHTNAMAAVSMLKVQARGRGVSLPGSDYSFLSQRCKLYQESLRIGEENARPTLTTGEATVSGSVGFRSSSQTVRNGLFVLDWKVNAHVESNQVWSKIDFEGPSRKVTQIRVRSSYAIPQELTADTSERFRWLRLAPKEVRFQVSSAAVGGEFIDIATLSVPKPTGDDGVWVREGRFRTNKSKSWRVMVQSFHDEDDDDCERKLGPIYESIGYYVGLQVELFEVDIANDPLQRLHSLHNASLSFQSLLSAAPEDGDSSGFACDRNEVEQTIASMKTEADKIEALYVDAAHSVHRECHRRLDGSLKARKELEDALLSLSGTKVRNGAPDDAWNDCWWDDFLVIARMYASDSQQTSICERLMQELDGFLHGVMEPKSKNGLVCFPEFSDINGLRTALNLRISSIRDGIGGRASRKSRAALQALAEGPERGASSGNGRDTCFRCPVGAHAKCMRAIHSLSPHPSPAEKFENSHCKVCKADWFQTGPKCSHCKIGEELEDLVPDQVTVLILSAIHSILKGQLGGSILSKSTGADVAARVTDRARLFFELLDAQRRERTVAWRMWRAHLDLLNDLDELNQCKSTMRLAYEGEDLTLLQEEQLNAIVAHCDVSARYHDHAAKQAMALGDLRRAKDTMRYLKNQSSELVRQQSTPQRQRENKNCIVCLSAFEDAECAVLRCGHSFHLTPCLERLQAGSSSSLISCPMRCRLRTERKDVLIATERPKDDGSRNGRTVKGSLGTKVSRLVADILDVRDLGDKGVVFSQWEDMLDIVQQALMENHISFVRAASLRQISSSTETFRQKECTLLLLNVKNGAEGLTLLEATHVFMVEPLLNYGLDSQAINRICRIGQNRKTFVHRYLIEDTIEMKIDRIRAEHQDEQIEDAIHEGKKSGIRAGGIDGGFQSHEELLDMLQP